VKIGEVYSGILNKLFQVEVINDWLVAIKQRSRLIRRISVNGVTFRIEIDTIRELRRARTLLMKEIDTIGWIDLYVKPGDVVYDVGSNIGLYSLYLAKRMKGRCTILSFEPESLNFSKLNINIHLNGLENTIIPYCLAIGVETRVDKFYVNTFQAGAALHALKEPVDNLNKEFSPQHLQGIMSVSLDELTTSLEASFPNHLKIDVDGAEEMVVNGGVKTLSDNRVKSVLVEISKVDGRELRIAKVMSSAGFSLKGSGNTDDGKMVNNYIFVRDGNDEK
jgi:FkbM family methyltransferase